MEDNVVYSKEYIENIKMLLKQSLEEDDFRLVEEVINMLDENKLDNEFISNW
tara:strand:+ start:1693 stop:1848 length:156 start_codon:yes stop_codon:yes gene_type:complete